MSESSTRPVGVSWVAIVAVCLVSALVGGVIVSRFIDRKATTPLARSAAADARRAESRNDDVKALRADVARLTSALDALAARPPAATSAAPPVQDPQPSAPRVVPGQITQDELVTLFESSAPNVQKTRALGASLDDRFKKESFAAAGIKVDEVECRGESCRVRVSYAAEAPAEQILLELATALPDSHSFQDFASTGNGRRTITSHYIDETGKATARAETR